MLRRTAISIVAAMLLSMTASADSKKDLAMLVIVHDDSPTKTLTRSELDAIFRTRKREWSDGGRIIAFNFPPKQPVRVAFDRAVLGMGPDKTAKFWINRRVRGGNRPPRAVPSAKLMGKVVAKVTGAIGYLPEGDVPKGVRVVARIEKGKVIEP